MDSACSPFAPQILTPPLLPGQLSSLAPPATDLAIKIKYIKGLSIPLSVREQTGALGGAATHWALLGFPVGIRAALGGTGGCRGTGHNTQRVPLPQQWTLSATETLQSAAAPYQ